MDDQKPRKQLGELLKERGLISEGHIKYALQEQKITAERLGELFERLGFVTEHDVVATLSEQSGIPTIDVEPLAPEEAVLKLFNKNFCLNNLVLPIRRSRRDRGFTTRFMPRRIFPPVHRSRTFRARPVWFPSSFWGKRRK